MRCHISIYIHTYTYTYTQIYPGGLRGGPENGQNHGCEGAHEEAAKEPEVNCGGQNATKIGVFWRLKSSPKVSGATPLEALFWPKWSAWGSLATLCFCFFLGLVEPAAGPKIAKTLRFCFCGTDPILVNLAISASFCGTRRTAKEPALFAETFSIFLSKVSPNRPFCGEKRFMNSYKNKSCEGTRFSCTFSGAPWLLLTGGSFLR